MAVDVPNPLELSPRRDPVADCAVRAERLRQRGAEVAFLRDPEQIREHLGGISARVNEFLGRAVTRVRTHFAGKVTYASVHLEGVDWTPFDIVSVDLYRSAEIADRFAEGILVAQGKPVAITMCLSTVTTSLCR